MTRHFCQITPVTIHPPDMHQSVTSRVKPDMSAVRRKFTTVVKPATVCQPDLCFSIYICLIYIVPGFPASAINYFFAVRRPTVQIARRVFSDTLDFPGPQIHDVKFRTVKNFLKYAQSQFISVKRQCVIVIAVLKPSDINITYFSRPDVASINFTLRIVQYRLIIPHPIRRFNNNVVKTLDLSNFSRFSILPLFTPLTLFSAVGTAIHLKKNLMISIRQFAIIFIKTEATAGKATDIWFLFLWDKWSSTPLFITGSARWYRYR